MMRGSHDHSTLAQPFFAYVQVRCRARATRRAEDEQAVPASRVTGRPLHITVRFMCSDPDSALDTDFRGPRVLILTSRRHNL
jgi:hypothetical protein